MLMDSFSNASRQARLREIAIDVIAINGLLEMDINLIRNTNANLFILLKLLGPVTVVVVGQFVGLL